MPKRNGSLLPAILDSFQLMSDGRRWWLVTIFWQDETLENPIPANYLAGKK